MKVGDLVVRKNPYPNQKESIGPGIVLSKQMSGLNPTHPCVTVYYPSMNKTYDIAERLVEVISEV